MKNDFLRDLLLPSSFFLIGEKGNGKTAYAVFLANNFYQDTRSKLKYIRETEYAKFVELKRTKNLQISDYSSIWKVVLLLLLADSIESNDVDSNPFTKPYRLKAIRKAIDKYYNSAFSPEIIYALEWVEHSKVAAEMLSKFLAVEGSEESTLKAKEYKMQLNLLYLQREFEKALKDLKLKANYILFIDGIDIRPGNIPFPEYLDCIKGLANAVWSLNNDFFPTIRDSKGRLRVVLLVRPDIFNSIGLQNTTNKVRDNSVYLDWRTTYPNYRTSRLFELADNLLSAQQDETLLKGKAWDFYFPWKSASTSPKREFDDSFMQVLRLSYSRPRDIVSIMQIMQEEFCEKDKDGVFTEECLRHPDFRTKYSEYLMGNIKDQLSFYYNERDYEMFLRFFTYLEGNTEFTYGKYVSAYKEFTDYLLNHHDDIPEFVESEEKFLQFLYETNLICYIEDSVQEPFFRWCYRERSSSNISPKVILGKRYRIHTGLTKALNLGYAKITANKF